jgi:hypothetical protein
VDVSEVERVGLGQIAHFELYGDSELRWRTHRRRY